MQQQHHIYAHKEVDDMLRELSRLVLEQRAMVKTARDSGILEPIV
jgi:hypothetical protein